MFTLITSLILFIPMPLLILLSFIDIAREVKNNKEALYNKEAQPLEGGIK